MGLGKTVQMLALLLAEREGGAEPAPTLLVCPMSVVGNWQREAERFAPSLKVHVHHGSERLAGGELAGAAAGSHLVVTTYGMVVRDQEALAGVEWGRVVLDEAQNIKNTAARQTQAVRALRAPQRVALTGTPVENRLSELWSIMEFCNHGLLAVGRTIPEAFITMYWLDRACQAQTLAISSGRDLKFPDEETIKKTNDRYQPGQRRRIGELEWAGLLRLLERRYPGFRD